MIPRVEQLEGRCNPSNAFNNPVISDSLAHSLQIIADIQIAANQAAGIVPSYPVTYSPAPAAPAVPPAPAQFASADLAAVLLDIQAHKV